DTGPCPTLPPCGCGDISGWVPACAGMTIGVVGGGAGAARSVERGTKSCAAPPPRGWGDISGWAPACAGVTILGGGGWGARAGLCDLNTRSFSASALKQQTNSMSSRRRPEPILRYLSSRKVCEAGTRSCPTPPPRGCGYISGWAPVFTGVTIGGGDGARQEQ